MSKKSKLETNEIVPSFPPIPMAKGRASRKTTDPINETTATCVGVTNSEEEHIPAKVPA